MKLHIPTNNPFLFLGSTRDQEQQNVNYGSKVRGGLARQEAVDGKGYLSRGSFLCLVDFQFQ